MGLLFHRHGLCRSTALRITFAVFAALLAAWASFAPGHVNAQDDVPLTYLTFNTDLTLDQDGNLRVSMVQQVAFDGEFSTAFFDIPTDYTTAIDSVHVFAAATEDDNFNVDDPHLRELAPDRLTQNGDAVTVEWSYPPTQPGDVRLFVIEYTARNVVWTYPDRDEIRWQAVNADRSGLAVEQSRVRLSLPSAIPPDTIAPETSLAHAIISQTGTTIEFETRDLLPDGIPFVVAATFPHGYVSATAQPWQREADSKDLNVEVSRFQSELTINADGSVEVAEATEVQVNSGTLYQAFRAIKLLYVEDVTRISVSQNGVSYSESGAECAGCYMVHRTPRPANWVYFNRDQEQITIRQDDAGEVAIDWFTLDPITDGSTVRFQLNYRLVGALRIDDDSQLMTWQVVPDYGIDVHNATLRLRLPPGLNAAAVTVDGPDGQGPPRVDPDGSLYFAFDGPVAPGGWQVAITLPADATTALPPPWQQQIEATIAEADAAAVQAARRALFTRIAGILVLIGSILAGVFAWMRGGRRRVRESMGGYLSEPPSPISPAIVSYLVDRRADEQGVLGALFYLATLGAIEIDLEEGIRLRRTRDDKLPAAATQKDRSGASVKLPPQSHLRRLFDQVVLPHVPAERWITLDELAPALRHELPTVYAALARDVQGYFIGKTRPASGGSISTIVWLVVYGTLMALLLMGVINVFTTFVVGFVVLIGLLIWSETRRGRSSYTESGLVEAERWQRFKTYLLNIKEYGDLAAAQEIIDRYFGYAVALGVEEVVLTQAAELGARRPVWMPLPPNPADGDWQVPPSDSPRPASTGGIGSTPQQGGSRPPLRPPARPTLAGMSVGLGMSLKRASRDMGRLLQTAAGDAGGASRSVVLDSRLRRHEIEWQPGATMSDVLDGILKQSVDDAREIQRRDEERRRAARAAESAARSSHSTRTSNRSSSSRSSGGFGRSSSSRSSSSRSSSRSSSSRSSSSRSGGGGRSGFR